MNAKAVGVEISGLENAFNQAVELVQKLGAFSEETACKISNEALMAIPAGLAQDIVQRICNTAEMGDVTMVNSTAAGIKAHGDFCVPLSNQMVQLAG